MLRVPIREAMDTGQPLAMSELEDICAQFGHRDDFADTLILLAADAADPVSSAATWLIKHVLERGKILSPGQTGKLIEHLPAITAWGAQLHVCQSIRFLAIPPNYAAALLGWLRPLRRHDRPFLRAWALDATCEVGRPAWQCDARSARRARRCADRPCRVSQGPRPHHPAAAGQLMRGAGQGTEHPC